MNAVGRLKLELDREAASDWIEVIRDARNVGSKLWHADAGQLSMLNFIGPGLCRLDIEVRGLQQQTPHACPR
jgi:hypothetical protein